MKISNNALNFLLAQYRAIFKRAYVKGLASAVILTAGLAVGQAQADPSNLYLYDAGASNDSGQPSATGGWTKHETGSVGGGSGALANMNTIAAGAIAGNGLNFVSSYETNIEDKDAIKGSNTASSGALIIAAEAANANYNFTTMSGYAAGGWAQTASGDATATHNNVDVKSGGQVNLASADHKGGKGSIFGGYSKAANGTATADNNFITIKKGADGVTNYAFQVDAIGGQAQGATGGVAHDNHVLINQDEVEHAQIINANASGSNIIGGKAVSLATTAVGDYIAHTNEVVVNKSTYSGSSDFEGSIIGGIATLGKAATNKAASLQAYDNQVTLTNSVINNSGSTGAYNLVGNLAINESTYKVDTVSTHGNSGFASVTISNSTLDNVGVFGGSATNAGSISVADELVSIENTSIANSGSRVFGALGNVSIINTTDVVNASVSGNKVTVSADTKTANTIASHITGATLEVKSGTGISVTDFSKATFNLTGNSVEVSGNVKVTGSSIVEGAAITVANGSGSSISANNNSVTFNATLDGTNIEPASIIGANVITVTGDKASKLSVNNNIVTIGADAHVTNADILAAHVGTGLATQQGLIHSGNTAIVNGYYNINDDTANDKFALTGDDVKVGSSAVIYVQDGTLNVGGLQSGDANADKFYNGTGTVANGAKVVIGTADTTDGINVYNSLKFEGDDSLIASAEGAVLTVDAGKRATEGDADQPIAVTDEHATIYISQTGLANFLTRTENLKYTLDSSENNKVEVADAAGALVVTSGATVDFGAQVTLNDFDFTDSSTAAGKIKVDTGAFAATNGSYFRADTVTLEHALVTSNKDLKADLSNLEDYKLDDTSGVAIEANVLNLGSNAITADQSDDITFGKATARDEINFTVGQGTYQLASTVAGNNYMRTDDQQSQQIYFTALNGTVNGDVNIISGGKLSIEYGHWIAQGKLTLSADETSNEGGTLEVGIDNDDATERNYIAKGNAKALPDATLVLDQALTVDVSKAGTATITVDGKNTVNDEALNRLGVYDKELALDTVGDDHYVMLDLSQGLTMVGATTSAGALNLVGEFDLDVASGGVVKVSAADLNSLLTQNDTSSDRTKGAIITVSDQAHLQVTGDVSADFNDFGQASDTNGIKLDDAVMSANSLSLIHESDPDEIQNASYVGKIAFGSESGTVAVSDAAIHDYQQVTTKDGTNVVSQVVFAQGTLDISSSLTSRNDTLVLGESGAGTNVAHLHFYGTDIDESNSEATTVGTIDVANINVVNGSVDVLNGAWVGQNFSLGATGKMSVGGVVTVGNETEHTVAKLSADKLTMAQGSLLEVKATGTMSVNEVNLSGLAAATADTGIHVAGTLVISGSSAENGGVVFGNESSITIANNGVLKFGAAATTGAILDTSSTKSFSGSGSLTSALDTGYHKIENKGGELHLALGSDVIFDGDAIKALKTALFTSSSFDTGVQLTDGGVLNIGDASFYGIDKSKFVTLTAPGTSGYTVAWSEVADFADVYGNDVTNNVLSQVNVNSIQPGTKVQGHWGSLSMSESGPTSQVTLEGNTTLYNAAGNNGFFISDAAHSDKRGAIVESHKDLKLIGGGEIGTVSLLEAGSYTADKNLTVLEVSGGATTIAAIDAKDSANIASGTLVNLYSDTTVTGNITNIDTVEAYQGAQVTAANAKVDEVSTQNADIAIAEDLDFNQAYVFGGSVTAKNADMTPVTTGGNDGEIAVINGGLFKVTDTLTAHERAIIQVGVDTSTISEADITLDDGTVAGGTGYFEVGTLELNGATLVIDPEYDEATSIGAALKFKKGREIYGTNDAGTLVGKLHIGKNAAYGIGATIAETEAAIADFKLGSALDQDKYGSILYLNGQLTVDNGSEIALNAHSDNIRDSLLYTVTSEELNQEAALGLGKNTAIIMTEKAFADAQGDKTGTAIHFNRQDAVINGAGGEIVLAGDFDVTDQLTIFQDNGNAADSTKTGVNVIGSIDVRTLNGFLYATLSGEDAGKVNLEVDTDRAYQVMSEASDPVIATLIAYAPSGSQGGNTGSGSGEGETDPASKTEAQNALAQNSNGRSGPIIELPGEGGSSEPNEPTNPGEGTGEGGEGGNEPNTPAPTPAAKSSFLNAVIINTHGAPAEQVARLGAYGGTAQVGLAAANSNADVLASRFGIGANSQSLNLASNGMGGTLWVAPIYKSQDSDGFAAQGLNYGVDFDLYGVALGGDYKVTNEITVGAMFNVGSGDLDGQGNTAAAGVSNDFDYFGFGLYGAYQAGALTVTADLSYTQVDNDLEGNNELGKVSASADTTAWSLGVTGQYQFNFAAVDVTPHAGLRFTSLDLDDYGVNAAGHGTVANFDSDTMSVFSIPVGVTFAKSFKSETWTVTPALDLHVTGQFGDDEAEGTVAWSGTNLSTNVTSEVFDNFTYGATVGVETQSVSGFSFGLGLGYTGSSNMDEFSAQANARFTF